MYHWFVFPSCTLLSGRSLLLLLLIHRTHTYDIMSNAVSSLISQSMVAAYCRDCALG